MPPLPAPLTAEDEIFLRRALQLARDNVEQGDGGPFGAVIVRAGAIIAEGRNQVIARHDPTAHAEIQAIRAACRHLRHFHLEGCALYASSEPCPLCLAAAYWARVERVIYANDRRLAAAIGFCDDELYEQLKQPPNARRIPAFHLPLKDAEAPLLAWRDKNDRVPY
jgi:tRNA(Arg) A34 adenosine deaminase TadA